MAEYVVRCRGLSYELVGPWPAPLALTLQGEDETATSLRRAGYVPLWEVVRGEEVMVEAAWSQLEWADLDELWLYKRDAQQVRQGEDPKAATGAAPR